MLMRRHHRPGQRGQVLVAALAIIALFGLLAAAVLMSITSAETQSRRANRTAARNVLAEGAAQYAVTTVGNGATSTCGGPPRGSATYSPEAGVTDTLAYAVQWCEPNYSSQTAGANCALCVLSTTNSALVSNNVNSMINIRGEIAVNGGVALQGAWRLIKGAWSWSGSTLCSSTLATPTTCAGNPEFIGVAGNPSVVPGSWPPPSPLAATSSLPYSPAPTVINPIGDPLAYLSAPVMGVVASPIQLVNKGTTTLTPGTYSGTMSIGGQQKVVLNAGTYVFTGNIRLLGGGVLDGSAGVTIVMTCSSPQGSQTVSRACNPGEAGGSLDVTGGGQYLLVGPSSGPYTHLVIFQDRNNTSQIDIGGSGNANTLSGGVYARSANVDIGGNGSDVFQSNGRLVALTVTIHVNASAGLNLIGAVINGPSCDLYHATVTGTEVAGGVSTVRLGEVTFAAGVNCAGRGIVSFAYVN